ncbi:hypothetical protein METSCH_C07090 [Metschnikowia aff. pulcherrima]|uniref:Uncharacterized protein n=1 Tax=Metschnikowia aff. pulcherrima TaxID=2163413 RepID=A0A4P6XN45_9ASCO|nr:hypothetical protein METSCH_C07090 [Metschnikowia aff. pulcherrima]
MMSFCSHVHAFVKFISTDIRSVQGRESSFKYPQDNKSSVFQPYGLHRTQVTVIISERLTEWPYSRGDPTSRRFFIDLLQEHVIFLFSFPLLLSWWLHTSCMHACEKSQVLVSSLQVSFYLLFSHFSMVKTTFFEFELLNVVRKNFQSTIVSETG